MGTIWVVVLSLFALASAGGEGIPLSRASGEARCGSEFGNKRCGDIGRAGECCSKFGFCARNAASCLKRLGCQSDCDESLDKVLQLAPGSSPVELMEEESNQPPVVKQVSNAVPLCPNCNKNDLPRFLAVSESSSSSSESESGSGSASNSDSSSRSSHSSHSSHSDQSSSSGSGSSSSSHSGSTSSSASHSSGTSHSSEASSSSSSSHSSGSTSSSELSSSESSSWSSSSESSSGQSSTSQSSSSSSDDPVARLRQATEDAAAEGRAIIAAAEAAAIRIKNHRCASGENCVRKKFAVMVPRSPAPPGKYMEPSQKDLIAHTDRLMNRILNPAVR